MRVLVSSIRPTLLLVAAIALLPFAAFATTIDFGQAPVPEGPVASIMVGGVTATGLQQSGTLIADVQRNSKGIGVASGANPIQNAETLVLDFGQNITLQGFVLFFDDTSAFPDPFTVAIGDGVTSTPVVYGATDGPLQFLPPSNEDAGVTARWFVFDVAGAPTGSVVEISGGLNSSFRVKTLTFIPEPGTAWLLGGGLLGLSGYRRRRR